MQIDWAKLNRKGYLSPMENYYYILAQVPVDMGAEIDELSHSEFECSGIEEFAIEEARVDEILGERSYSGADLPLSVIHEVENTVLAGINKIKFYFADKPACEVFQAYLKTREIESELIEEEVNLFRRVLTLKILSVLFEP